MFPRLYVAPRTPSQACIFWTSEGSKFKTAFFGGEITFFWRCNYKLTGLRRKLDCQNSKRESFVHNYMRHIVKGQDAP